MTEARQYGVDGMVLARLVNDAALDGEAWRLGLSTGDETVREQVVATPAFQGADGNFDREAYIAALERGGLRPAEFEELLRARGHPRPARPRRAVRRHHARRPRRGPCSTSSASGAASTGSASTPALLAEPIPAPTDAELAGRARRPRRRALHPPRDPRRSPTPASPPKRSPPTIEIPEAELRAAYDADHRHLPDPRAPGARPHRLPTAAEAAAAKARLDAGEIDFDALAAERGLKPEDIDQGIVAADALPARPATRSSAPTGPASSARSPTPLGPALYRDQRHHRRRRPRPSRRRGPTSPASRALDEAQASRSPRTPRISRICIAGGATLEEIASETVDGARHPRAQQPRPAAASPTIPPSARPPPTAEVGEETDLVELADGGLATLRVDRIDPPAVIPLDEIRDRVAADWTADADRRGAEQARRRLHRRAQGRPQLRRPRRSASAARSAAPAR